MNNSNSYLIEKSGAEIQDLKRFWGDLSWWERDESMRYAASNLDVIMLSKVPDDLKKRDKILEEIKKLDISNAKARPSKLRSKLRLVPHEGQKPNFSICLSKIYALSIDDLVNLGKYLGIGDIESFREHPNDLRKLYLDIGANHTSAIFFAFRNYLGKLSI